MTRSTKKIYPILLAAGPSSRLNPSYWVEHLAGKTPFEIATANCVGMETPIAILGHRASLLARRVSKGHRIVLNKNWQSGQIGSLLTGLELVPADAAFMLYPVDFVFLTPRVVWRLRRAFEIRTKGQEIFMPRFKDRSGHPVVFTAKMRAELERAPTAREAVYSDLRRVCYVPVRTPSIWKDFEPPVSNSRFRR
jgi:CTP:molybdopterin cytidylyltransferase MocA